MLLPWAWRLRAPTSGAVVVEFSRVVLFVEALVQAPGSVVASKPSAKIASGIGAVTVKVAERTPLSRSTE